MDDENVDRCRVCKSDKIRYILDYKHILLGKATESLWVCDNCYYRFKRKYTPNKVYDFKPKKK